VWCPEIASKAYIDGVRVLADHDDFGGPAEVGELVSAMAGGWNAQLIVEAPDVASEASSSVASTRRPAATTLALAAAARRTGGRYACVLPDAGLAAAHVLHPPAAVVVGDADEAMARLEGVDLLVVDARRPCSRRPGPGPGAWWWCGTGPRRWPRPWAPGHASCAPSTCPSARASRSSTSASERGRACTVAGAAPAGVRRVGGSGTSTTTPARSTSSGGSSC
jgi:hypothetical protein